MLANGCWISQLTVSVNWDAFAFYKYYEGCNASGGIQPSVYTGFNALAENLVTFRPSHSLTKIPCFDILNRVKRNGAVQDCMQVKTVIWYRVVCG